MCLATARDKEGRGAAATEFPQRDAGRVPAEVRACHPTGMKRNSLFTAGNMAGGSSPFPMRTLRLAPARGCPFTPSPNSPA